jgi:uncharacterized RDD family membrane protein YckC
MWRESNYLLCVPRIKKVWSIEMTNAVFDAKEYFEGDRSILWSRFFAMLIDFALIGLLAFALPLFMGMETETFKRILPFFLIGIVLYYWLLESFYGVTLGKKVIGIKVVNSDGNKPNLLQCLIRTLTRIIEVNPFLLGAVIAGIFAYFTPKRQRIGDLLSKTYVIYK